MPGLYPVRSRLRRSDELRRAHEHRHDMPLRQQKSEFLITDEFWEAVQRTLSPPRLQPYLESCGYDNKKSIDLYIWNVKIGQSFHFPLQALEVSLRNSIHWILQDAFGENWHKSLKLHAILSEDRLQDLNEVKSRIQNRGLPDTVDQVVAGTPFGFWVGLLHKRYNPPIWGQHLRTAFPSLPQSRGRKSVYEGADRVLRLRNRIFHHEPLIDRDLSNDYGNVLNLLRWICPHTEAWARAYSSVPTVLRERP